MVDRTLPQSKVGNILEGVITGVGIRQNRQAVQTSLIVLGDIVRNGSRFTVTIATEALKGSGSGGTFPPPLNWGEVQHICNNNKTDAVITVETFDSDWIVTNAKKEKIQKKDGVETKVEYYRAEGVATIKEGIRFYDPKNQQIIDQYHFNKSNTWHAEGKTATDAVAALMQKRDAVMRVASMMGSSFAYRISPAYVSVNRQIYSKSKKNMDMKIGLRHAKVNNYDEAAKSWERASTDPNPKTAGKATYNLAVYYEIIGDLQKARKMAQKAYANYGIKDAIRYTAIIENRINDNQRLDQQLKD